MLLPVMIRGATFWCSLRRPLWHPLVRSSLIVRRKSHELSYFAKLRHFSNPQILVFSRSSSSSVVGFVLSDIGEGIKEVTIKEWYVKPGDSIGQFDKLCEVQSDKASVTITSRYDGLVKKLYYDVDEIAETGSVLVDFEVSSDNGDGATTEIPDTSVSTDKKTLATPAVSSIDNIDKKSLGTPAVRRLAAENNIKLSSVSGSGKEGRVLKEDLLRLIGVATPTKSDQNYIQLKGIQRVMMETMTSSLKIPQFGYDDEVDVTAMLELYARCKGCLSEGQVKLTLMPFIIKACSMALLHVPALNSHFDDSNAVLKQMASHNIGVAMDTPDGLLVPNIKHVENLTVLQIAKDLNRLMELGRTGKLGSSDLSDGTITLSNIGSIGGTTAKPLILPPQVAIVALGRVRMIPRFKDDDITKVKAAKIMNVCWSADHRVLDGATVARFCNLFVSNMENPLTLLLA